MCFLTESAWHFPGHQTCPLGKKAYVSWLYWGNSNNKHFLLGWIGCWFFCVCALFWFCSLFLSVLLLGPKSHVCGSQPVRPPPCSGKEIGDSTCREYEQKTLRTPINASQMPPWDWWTTRSCTKLGTGLMWHFGLRNKVSLAGEMAYGLSTFFSVSSLLPLFDTERKNLIMSPTAFTWEPSVENLAQHEVLLAFF